MNSHGASLLELPQGRTDLFWWMESVTQKVPGKGAIPEPYRGYGEDLQRRWALFAGTKSAAMNKSVLS